MGLGTGVNKEGFLVFLCGYLIIFSAIITAIQIEMKASIYSGEIPIPISKVDGLTEFFNLFNNILNWPADLTFVPYLITIPFIWIPKFAIVVILGSYIKDML